jgi:hypothetical protein
VRSPQAEDARFGVSTDAARMFRRAWLEHLYALSSGHITELINSASAYCASAFCMFSRALRDSKMKQLPEASHAQECGKRAAHR